MQTLLPDKVVFVSGGSQGLGAGVFLLSDRSGVVTGSVIDWDQRVVGAYD